MQIANSPAVQEYGVATHPWIDTFSQAIGNMASAANSGFQAYNMFKTGQNDQLKFQMGALGDALKANPDDREVYLNTLAASGPQGAKMAQHIRASIPAGYQSAADVEYGTKKSLANQDQGFVNGTSPGQPSTSASGGAGQSAPAGQTDQQAAMNTTMQQSTAPQNQLFGVAPAYTAKDAPVPPQAAPPPVPTGLAPSNEHAYEKPGQVALENQAHQADFAAAPAPPMHTDDTLLAGMQASGKQLPPPPPGDKTMFNYRNMMDLAAKHILVNNDPNAVNTLLANKDFGVLANASEADYNRITQMRLAVAGADNPISRKYLTFGNSQQIGAGMMAAKMLGLPDDVLQKQYHTTRAQLQDQVKSAGKIFDGTPQPLKEYLIQSGSEMITKPGDVQAATQLMRAQSEGRVQDAQVGLIGAQTGQVRQETANAVQALEKERKEFAWMDGDHELQKAFQAAHIDAEQSTARNSTLQTQESIIMRNAQLTQAQASSVMARVSTYDRMLNDLYMRRNDAAGKLTGMAINDAGRIQLQRNLVLIDAQIGNVQKGMTQVMLDNDRMGPTVNHDIQAAPLQVFQGLSARLGHVPTLSEARASTNSDSSMEMLYSPYMTVTPQGEMKQIQTPASATMPDNVGRSVWAAIERMPPGQMLNQSDFAKYYGSIPGGSLQTAGHTYGQYKELVQKWQNMNQASGVQAPPNAAPPAVGTPAHPSVQPPPQSAKGTPASTVPRTAPATQGQTQSPSTPIDPLRQQWLRGNDTTRPQLLDQILARNPEYNKAYQAFQAVFPGGDPADVLTRHVRPEQSAGVEAARQLMNLRDAEEADLSSKVRR